MHERIAIPMSDRNRVELETKERDSMYALMAQRMKSRHSHEYAFESASWACRERRILTFDGTENEECHQRDSKEALGRQRARILEDPRRKGFNASAKGQRGSEGTDE